MRLVMVADIGAADVPLFQEYERQVLPVLAEYGELERRVRSVRDGGRTEVHLMSFPDHAAVERFRADPRRVAAQQILVGLDFTHRLIEVEDV